MRHKKVAKRQTEGDKIYGSVLVAKFINRMMKDGKKTTSENLFYGAMEILSQKGENALEVFEKAIQNVGPGQEIKARRVGGASYQIPQEVRGDRKTSLAIRWLIEAARKRSNVEYRSFAEKLAAEFNDANQNLGEAVKKRDTAHRMAEANKAFSHFRI
ncbi:MAG: 30S ribosomal protein S7 [Candidatus Levybacteria bacterium RIFOXYA1_FULL_41_10]|nr:MAG: 30S ribosomal protein S7 [Candidatus Levybacteria bacterium GW2011_GWA1_39_32]KKR50677.1 MAG: 30S ribosomal protein S7 [Candidatus Levybacteria bacterium GW2011_GWC1_40_19]KKR73738.1 MAG: 30S ribosomal protein S7 [Candidatus Levybacteria bacterium GW2011_GWC2_40_7]KKR95362.1 MAG: 30S ribosomal protein S7 [Candidatus Levybacteria bacterium GW2011_GWA2_41_15]KKS02130.1 MAG: 30S ribosomal protein S7 [Candidatus Levybacteria bacterium GW2011_GWB1_41_21]OGH21208.1 MAG: 30S ribosomal protein